MNLLYCGDDGIRAGLYLSVMSICRNTSEKLNVYVITAGWRERKPLSSDFIEKLQHAANRTGGGCDITLIDVTKRFCTDLPLANMDTRFTPFCMLRLFADNENDIPDKILYLDTDVLCRADISGLYATDINDVEIAGVPDRYGKWFFGNVLLHTYLNSGVLLMNMKNIRQSGLFEKCRMLCKNKKMFMPDQTALNKFAKKAKLPRKYNEQGKIKSDTVLKHFTTFFKFFPYIRAVTVKPWNEEKLHRVLKIYEFDDLICEYKNSFQKECLR